MIKGTNINEAKKAMKTAGVPRHLHGWRMNTKTNKIQYGIDVLSDVNPDVPLPLEMASLTSPFLHMYHDLKLKIPPKAYVPFTDFATVRGDDWSDEAWVEMDRDSYET